MKNSKFAFESVRTFLAIIIALLIAFITIFLVSDEPTVALKAFLLGPVDSLRHFGNVIELMIPLTFAGLSISLMFCAGQFNLGAEGGFFIGAVAAAFIAIGVPLPAVVHPIVAIIAGGLAGALFCSIPAFLKVKWGASEMVSSLMFNYIALFLGLYLINYLLRDTQAGAMVSYKLPATARLARLVPRTRIHAGVFVAIAAIVIMYLYTYYTRWGYRTRIIGINSSFARYSGIKTAAVIISSQVIGGFIAGVGGSVQLLGMYKRFTWQQLPGYGWDGIIVAILARNNPAFVPVGALFLAYLRIGADLMARKSDVQSEFISIIQGVVIVLIAAEGFLAHYRHKMVVKEAEAARQLEEV